MAESFVDQIVDAIEGTGQLFNTRKTRHVLRPISAAQNHGVCTWSWASRFS